MKNFVLFISLALFTQPALSEFSVILAKGIVANTGELIALNDGKYDTIDCDTNTLNVVEVDPSGRGKRISYTFNIPTDCKKALDELPNASADYPVSFILHKSEVYLAH